MKNKTSKSQDKEYKKYRQVENTDGTKTLFIDRQISDRAIYKPLNSFIF